MQECAPQKQSNRVEFFPGQIRPLWLSWGVGGVTGEADLLNI